MNALCREFLDLGTATVYEAAGQVGAMVHTIRPLFPGVKLCGPALPVRCPPADNLTVHVAVAQASPGSVLVVDTGEYLEAGFWGEVLTVAALERGIVGLVTNGAVRDTASIRSLGFPVFAQGVSIKATTKVKLGSVGEPVLCGGVLVSAGDLVVADEDGVVVVPQEQASSVLEKARQRFWREREVIEALRKGKTTLELLGLSAIWEAKK